MEDQEGAKRCWSQRLGFAVVVDEPYGDERPQVPETLANSPVLFTCDDIQQTYQELIGRGVRFPTPPTKMPFGWWSLFEDDEGTRYALEQRP